MYFDDINDFGHKEKTYYVLWVRHCLSCANIIKYGGIPDPMGKGYREPLCTKQGMIEALIFGRNLERIINNFPDRIKYAINGVNLYSSVLPRAIETAKIISIGIPHLVDKPIHRMLYVQEEYSKPERRPFISHKKGSTNITNLVKSDCHVKLLNDILGGAHISNKILGCDTKKCDIFVATESDYDDWKKNILTKLDHSKLNLIVTHGKTMRNNILRYPETKGIKKYKNLGAGLIEYKYNPVTQKVTDKFIMTIDVDSSKYHSKINIQDSKYFTCRYKYHRDIEKKYCPE
jgi:hypothetical protein